MLPIRTLLTFLLLLALAVPFRAAAVTVTDARGPHTFDQPPQRVVALDWVIAENLVELGITPIAMTDLDGYKTWVVRPALPDGIVNVGTRDEPNVERIAQLKPDLIILSKAQASLAGKLEQIAPVLLFDTFGTDQDNLQASRHIFLEMAALFKQTELARQKLARLDQRMSALKARLVEHFDGELPRVSVIRFNTQALIWVFGANSLPQQTLDLLGFAPAFPQPASPWGVTQKKTASLGRIKDGILLYLEPFEQANQLFASPLWKAMPVVRANRFAPVRSTWTYGGAMSVQYLAEAMTEALLQIKP